MPLPVHFRVGPADPLACRHEPTLGAVLAELFDEARRARATRIEVRLESSGAATRVTVAGDGPCIADPALRRGLADPAWMGDAPDVAFPAGLGLLVLGTRGATVRWRTLDAHASPGPGLRLALAPAHLVDGESTRVEADDAAPWPYGVAVTFEADEPVSAIRAAVRAAARHHPRPVALDGEAVARRAFLDGAMHAEPWRGLVFGVFEGPPEGTGTSDLNLHGRVVAAGLPRVTTLDGVARTVRADVDDCLGLPLAQPACTHAAVTPFLVSVRDAARRALYRAMAEAERAPRLSRADALRAAEAGVSIPQGPPALLPWLPAVADPDRPADPPAPVAVHDGAMVMEAELDAPEGQALHRALVRAGLDARVLAPEPRLAGAGWYERLPRIRAVAVRVTVGGVTRPLDAVPERAEGALREPRPEALAFELHLAYPYTDRSPVMTLDADLAFAGPEGAFVDEARPLVTGASDLDPETLAALVRAAYFCPSDAPDADAWATQAARADDRARRLAWSVLASEDEARRRAIAHAVTSELAWLLPTDRRVDITVEHGRAAVAIGPAPA